jgi:hypothetical protein
MWRESAGRVATVQPSAVAFGTDRGFDTPDDRLAKQRGPHCIINQHEQGRIEAPGSQRVRAMLAMRGFF